MRGRPPIPDEIKVAAGTYRKDRSHTAVDAGGTAPQPPKKLSAAARAFWKYYAPLLSERGILKLQDREALAVYCTAAARRAQAEEQIAKTGEVVKSPSGYPIQNPWLAIANKAGEQMRQWGAELGITPAARTRVRAPISPLARPTTARFFPSAEGQ
jgi:P27 family predicted phage terminase small subunit